MQIALDELRFYLQNYKLGWVWQQPSVEFLLNIKQPLVDNSPGFFWRRISIPMDVPRNAFVLKVGSKV